MNRKKKINETLKKRLKKKNSRLHKSNKPIYVAKAEREKLALAAEAAEQTQALLSTDMPLAGVAAKRELTPDCDPE